MSIKLLKKLKDKEDKLLDAIYEIQELLDTAEDGELSSLGSEFTEALNDFIYDNDICNFNNIREYIEESLDV